MFYYRNIFYSEIHFKFFAAHGNNLPYYQACANVRLVGSHCARFIHHIISEYGVDPDNVEIIGHSLGAHGAGYAGEALQKNHNIVLGKITGLDPAGPYFTGTKPTVRLDPTDAKIVTTVNGFCSTAPSFFDFCFA